MATPHHQSPKLPYPRQLTRTESLDSLFHWVSCVCNYLDKPHSSNPSLNNLLHGTVQSKTMVVKRRMLKMKLTTSKLFSTPSAASSPVPTSPTRSPRRPPTSKVSGISSGITMALNLHSQASLTI